MIPSGLGLLQDLELAEELILDSVQRVSLQSSLLAFTSRLRPLFVQLPLKAGKHLKELIFGEEPGVSVGPYLRHSSGARVLFFHIFDVNIEIGRRRFGRPRPPSGCRLNI